MSSKVASEETYVVVEDGRIDHVGENLATLDASFAGAPVIDLKGGSIGPGLTSFGFVGLFQPLSKSSLN